MKQYNCFKEAGIIMPAGFVGKGYLKEDLRAWLLKKEEEENNERDRPHVKDNHFANARIDGEMFLIRELLAELSKTGGPGATREKPPPRSFL